MKIIIPANRFVPCKGRGPILEPFEVTQSTLNFYKAKGIPYKIVDENESKKIKPITLPKVEESKIEEVVEEVIEEEIKEDNIPEEVIDESVKEELIEEVEEEVEESEEEGSMSEDQLSEMTKNDLKKILDDAGIQYKYNAKVDELKQLILDNNL